MEHEATLTLFAAALLVVGSVAYIQRKRRILAIAGALFFPICSGALVSSWGPISTALTAIFLVGTLGLSLFALALFAIDVIWAPFALEMTYLTFLCWILCPVAVILSGVGALF